jgi:hypothetical protein
MKEASNAAQHPISSIVLNKAVPEFALQRLTTKFISLDRLFKRWDGLQLKQRSQGGDMMDVSCRTSSKGDKAEEERVSRPAPPGKLVCIVAGQDSTTESIPAGKGYSNPIRFV